MGYAYHLMDCNERVAYNLFSLEDQQAFRLTLLFQAFSFYGLLCSIIPLKKKREKFKRA